MVEPLNKPKGDAPAVQVRAGSANDGTISSRAKKVSELMDERVSTLTLIKTIWLCAPEFRSAATRGMLFALLAKAATAGGAFIVAAAVNSKPVDITGTSASYGMGLWSLAGWSIIGLSCAFAALKLMEVLMGPFQMLASQKAEAYAESRVIDQAFAGLLALPRSSWTGMDVSEASARLDVRGPLKHFIYCVWRGVLPAVFEVVLSTMVLWSMGMGAASLAVAAAAVAYIVLSISVAPFVERRAKEASKSRGLRDSTVVRLLGSLELARAYGAREAFSKAREAGAARAAQSRLDVTRASALSNVSSWLGLVGGASAAFWIGADALSSGTATPGSFAALMAVSGVALVGMKNLAFAFSSIVGASGELSFAVLVIHEARRLGLGVFAEQPEPAQAAELVLDGVSVRFDGAKTLALGPIALRVEPGEKVWLVGASGAGKTTLMRALSGLIEVESGSVHFGGVDMLGPKHPAALALMPQEADALGASIRVNLVLGRARASDDQMWAALDAAGLRERVESGGGLDASPGAGGARYSGGERSRLALARALVSGRPILLLDEPTAALDAQTERDVLARLMVRSDLSAIISIHRIMAIPSGARVVVMDHGLIVQDGSREDLALVPGVFADLLRAAKSSSMRSGA